MDPNVSLVPAHFDGLGIVMTDQNNTPNVQFVSGFTVMDMVSLKSIISIIGWDF